jgi:disulfide oxidoreductase YuzD
MNTHIKAAIFAIGAACAMCNAAAAQGSAPDWIDANVRRMKFPIAEYVIGYAEISVPPNDSAESNTAIVRKNAMADLVGNMRSNVKTQSAMQTTEDTNYNVQTTFASSAAISSELEITNVQTEHYADSRQGILYAIAYAKRSDLAAYYQMQILLNLGSAQTMLQTAADLDGSGSKIQARKFCLKAKEHLTKTKEAREISAIAAPQTTENPDIEKQYANLLLLTETLWQSLLQNISVYVESSEDLLGKPASIAADKVKAGLSAVEWCTFAMNMEDADYALTITAEARQLSGQSKIVFCMANITAALVDLRSRKSIYNGVWEEKSGHISFENAGRDALTKAADKAAKEIINHFIEIKK